MSLIKAKGGRCKGNSHTDNKGRMTQVFELVGLGHRLGERVNNVLVRDHMEDVIDNDNKK